MKISTRPVFPIQMPRITGSGTLRPKRQNTFLKLFLRILSIIRLRVCLRIDRLAFTYLKGPSWSFFAVCYLPVCNYAARPNWENNILWLRQPWLRPKTKIEKQASTAETFDAYRRQKNRVRCVASASIGESDRSTRRDLARDDRLAEYPRLTLWFSTFKK